MHPPASIYSCNFHFFDIIPGWAYFHEDEVSHMRHPSLHSLSSQCRNDPMCYMENVSLHYLSTFSFLGRPMSYVLGLTGKKVWHKRKLSHFSFVAGRCYVLLEGKNALLALVTSFLVRIVLWARRLACFLKADQINCYYVTCVGKIANWKEKVRISGN